MKWVITIWSFYLVVLSFVPCSDDMVHRLESVTTSQITPAHTHDEGVDDHCTPFCNCGCCSAGITLFVFDATEFTPRSLHFSLKKVAFRNRNLVSNYEGNIWQPPQLA